MVQVLSPVTWLLGNPEKHRRLPGTRRPEPAVLLKEMAAGSKGAWEVVWGVTA